MNSHWWRGQLASRSCTDVERQLVISVNHHHYHHHYHICFMELGHLLTRSGLTYLEVSSKAYHDSFCQSGRSVSLPWVIYFEAFCLHVVSSFSCIPVICPKLALFLIPLQFVHLFCNLSQVYPAVLHIYFIYAAVILLASIALTAQISMPYNKTGRASVLYSFVLLISVNLYRNYAYNVWGSNKSLCV